MNKLVVVVLAIAGVSDIVLSFVGVSDPYLYRSMGLLELLVATLFWED